jgi:mono/diheme cytochrome c family protein
MMRLANVLCVTALAIGFISALASSVRAEEAAQNYQTFCAMCHGSGGGGDGPGAITLPVKPRKFTDCDRMRRVSDQEAYDVIRNGGTAANLSTDMPPWKNSLSEDETRDLVRYVKGFCNDNQAEGITKVRKR